MIKKSSVIVALLLVLCLAISSVSATSLDNSNSEDIILNSDGITTDDIDTLESCSVSNNFESDENVLSDNADQSKVNIEQCSISSDSNMVSESSHSNDDTSEKSISTNIPYGEDNKSESTHNDNISESSSISVNKVSSSVMNTSTSESDVSIQSMSVMNTESSSLLTGLSANLTSGSTADLKISIADIIKGSTTLKQYVLNNKKLPSTITVNGLKLTISQFSYLMSEAIKQINAKKSTSTKISVIKVTNLSSSSTIKNNASKSIYLTLAKTVASNGVNKKVLPAYVSFDGKKASFNVYTYGFAKILVFYKANNRLPGLCLFDSSVFKTASNTKTVSISSIIKAANNLKSYTISKKSLPSTVTVGNTKVSIAQFSYLMSEAIKKINAKKSISTKISIIKVTNSSASASIYKNANKSTYLNLAKTVANSGINNKKVPTTVNIGKKVEFKTYTYGFAKILSFYNSKKRLPNTCLFDSSVFSKNPSPSSKYLTVSQIASAAKTIKSYVASKKNLPETISVGGKKLSIGQFTYLMSAAIKKINSKQTSAKISIINVSKSSYSGQYISKTIDSNAVLKIANNISKYSIANKKAPNYVYIGGKKANFKVYTYLLAKDLAFYKDKGRLANKVSISSSAFSGSSNLLMKKGINEYNTINDISAYLKASGHCGLNSQIKALANSLTKNCNTTLQKANAIFNYVKNNVDYSFYYNSKKSASGALSSKKANCCDKANLVVALCRASGIASRYCHSSSCHFNSGLTVGHVWAQILVGNKWYVADTVSSRNTLGHINNWNTGYLGSLKQYSLLPF